jgi:hypothetical protein
MEQKQRRLEIAQDMLDNANSNPSSVWILVISPAENAAERNPIWVKKRHHAECDGPAEHHSKGRVPEVFPTMADALGEVCALTMRLLWRGLGFCTSKSINVFLVTKGSILFEHTT